MRKLIAIALAGVVETVSLAFVVKAGVNMIEGRPIAHATGIRLLFLRDALVLVVIAIVAALCVIDWILSWYAQDNLFAFSMRRRKWK